MQTVPAGWEREFQSTLMNPCYAEVTIDMGDDEDIVYTKEALTSFEISQSLSPINAELPQASLKFSISTIDLDVRALQRSLTRMKKVTARVGITINGEPAYINAGTFWLDTWDFPNGGIEASFEARDALYFLQAEKYIYGVYRRNGISLYDLANEVLTYAQSNFPCVTTWQIDNSLSSINTTAPFPVCTYAECLQYVAQASGSVLKYDRDGVIRFSLTSGDTSYTYAVTDEVCFSYPQLTLQPELRKLRCTVYNYSLDEIYSDAEHYPNVNGDATVSAVDAALVLAAAAHIGAGEPSGLTPEQEIKADADRDGMITAADAALIQEYAAKCGSGKYENTPDGWALFLNIKIGYKEKVYDAIHDIDGETNIIITHGTSAEVNVMKEGTITISNVNDYSNATEFTVTGTDNDVRITAYGFPIEVSTHEYRRDVSDSGDDEYIDNPLVTNNTTAGSATQDARDFLSVRNVVECPDLRIDPRLDAGDTITVNVDGEKTKYGNTVVTDVKYRFTGMFRGSITGRIDIPETPTYDETKIAVIELDENDEPTGDYNEYDNFRDAAIELLSNPYTVYMMRIGDDCTFANTIPENAFNYSYASSNYGISGDYNNLHRLYTGYARVVGANAFLQCENLKEVEFKQVTTILTQAFLNCAIEQLDFPASLVAIYGSAFTQQGGSNHVLKSITFRDGLKALYSGAFTDNDGLHYVELPSSLIQGESAFNSCNFLEVIRLHKAEMPSGFNLNGNSGCGCVVLDWTENLITTKMDADGNLMSGHPEDVIGWDTVANIRAYLGGYSMRGTVPAQQVQVEFLNDTAVSGAPFAAQDRLRRAVFAEDVTNIPSSMFYSCYDLTEIIIHKPENSISGAPWGATNATVVWTG